MNTILRARRTPTICAAALGALLIAAEAVAQNVCLPAASGVPGLGGAPDWFSGGAQPQFWPAEDDPRWTGSYLFTHGGGAANAHLEFRGLRTGTHVYLSFVVNVDPQIDTTDEVYIGISPGAGPDALIRVTPFSLANQTVNPPAFPTAVEFSSRVAVAGSCASDPMLPVGSFCPQQPAPDWLTVAGKSDLRVIRRAGEPKWSVLMRVPIAAPPAGLNLQNTFHVWFAAMVSHPAGPGGMPPAGVVEYDYPLGGPNFTTVVTSGNTTGWQPVRRDVAPTDATCVRGVTLSASDIGAEAPGVACTDPPTTFLSHSIKLTEPPPAPAGTLGQNVLCARPVAGSVGIAANDLQANFRIANWGSQPITTTTGWLPVPGGPATNTAAIAANTRGSIRLNFNMTAGGGGVGDVCTFVVPAPGVACPPIPPAPPRTRQRHQCMFVELSGAPGITFSTASAWTNMNFVNASTFKRDAEINVAGLPPKPGSPPAPGTTPPPRDVFLYVQVDNMPAQVSGDDPRPRPVPGVAAVAGQPPFAAAVVQPRGKIPPLPEAPYAQLRRTAPTYQVHAFHDTGRTVTLRGTTYKVLESQSSFGYFVDHQGDLLGWRHELQGARRIAPNYYHIGVPEGGARNVTTIIEAIESRWSASFHGGFNVPTGDFGDACDGGASLGFDVEYRFTPMLAAEAFYGHDRFDCAGETSKVNHLSANAKAYFGSIMWKPFVGAGIGQYNFDPGSGETGFNVFGGIQANPAPKVAIEGTAKYHVVDDAGVNANFLTLHAGVRIRF